MVQIRKTDFETYLMYKIPAILRWHEITWRVEPVQAKLNLALLFKEKAHLRDPALVDAWVTRGYERLIEAEQHHTYSSYLIQFLSPNVNFFLDRFLIFTTNFGWIDVLNIF